MDIATILMYVVMFGRQLAERTPTKIDDELINLIEVVRTDEWLRDWLDGKAKQPGGVLSIEAAPEGNLALALQRTGIDWDTLVKRLPEIISFISFIRSLLA